MKAQRKEYELKMSRLECTAMEYEDEWGADTVSKRVIL